MISAGGGLEVGDWGPSTLGIKPGLFDDDGEKETEMTHLDVGTSSSNDEEARSEDVAEESRAAAWDDWWGTDRLDSVGWAALFLWGALVVLATNTSFRDDFDWWDGWGVFFVGAGAIVLVEALVRLWMPSYRNKFGWTLFWGTAFLAVGLGGLASPVWYALPLIVIAGMILMEAFARSS